MARADIETGYSPDEIITRSQDEMGHSANLRVHIPKPWRAMIEQIVQSDAWPEYSSVQDFIRDAIYHRLHWTTIAKDRDHIPAVRAMVMQIRRERELNVIAQQHMTWRAFSDRIERTLQEMMQAGDWDLIAAWCEDTLDEIDDVPEPHRTRLADQLESWRKRAENRW